jgi:hypothetical protein
MARIYSKADEDKIRMQALVREWQRSGFLDAPQADRMQSELRVNLRRTNSAFRAILFLFAAIIVAASIALAFTTLGSIEKGTEAPVFFLAAAIYYSLAEFLVESFGIYRFGVEELFTLSSVALIGAAAGRTTSSDPVALVVTVLAGLAVYLRFGYLIAAVGAIVCAALIPIQFELSNELARTLAAAIFAGAFAGVRALPAQTEDHRLMQAAAWIGIYVALNLQLAFAHYGGWFYWWTYAMMWILPIVGLVIALRSKERELLDVNIVLGLVTIAINKSYLHLSRQPWDPILFGVFMIGTAVFLRRWLAGGTEGQRYGFTPVRLLASDRRALAMLGTASALLQAHVTSPSSTRAEPKPEFGGGRSGGAGASGNF